MTDITLEGPLPHWGSRGYPSNRQLVSKWTLGLEVMIDTCSLFIMLFLTVGFMLFEWEHLQRTNTNCLYAGRAS